MSWGTDTNWLVELHAKPKRQLSNQPAFTKMVETPYESSLLTLFCQIRFSLSHNFLLLNSFCYFYLSHLMHNALPLCRGGDTESSVELHSENVCVMTSHHPLSDLYG